MTVEMEKSAMVVHISPLHQVTETANATAATVMPIRYITCIIHMYHPL
jgi:hypothetical protein